MLVRHIAVDAIAGARGIIGLGNAKLATKGDSQIIVGLVKFSFKGVAKMRVSVGVRPCSGCC